MKHLFTFFVFVATALIGAVVLNDRKSVLPAPSQVEAHVPVPEPIPTVAGDIAEEQETTTSVLTTSPASVQIPEQNRESVPIPGRPVRIEIPNAYVGALVTDVGVTPEGNLDVPPNYVDVGWYKYGTIPGNMGSAVLDGHVDDGRLLDGVFKNLRRLVVGDDIYITTEQGNRLHFKVRNTDIYDTDRFPGELIFHEKGARLIKIITCHGKFSPSQDTYDQRLVVTAELVM